MKYWRLLWAVLIAGVVVMAGCGGGGGAVDSMSKGSVGVKVEWPALPEGVQTEMIPAASNSIKVEILREGLLLDNKIAVINRPQTTVRIDDVLVGSAVMRATAYPQASAGGVAQATAQVSIEIVKDQYKEFPITLASTIEQVNVTPGTTEILTTATKQLIATAKNAAGQTVLVPASSGFTWAVTSGSGFASVSSSGLLTGLAPGTATITATEKESHKVGTATVTVSEVSGDSTLEAAMAVAMPTAPVPGSAANVALLQAYENDANRPHTEAALRTELAKFVTAARANPNDAAAQTGLSFAILAIASCDAAASLGEDLFAGMDIAAATAAPLNKNLRLTTLSTQAMKTAGLRGTPRLPNLDEALKRTSRSARSKSLAVNDLQRYREAIRYPLLPALANVVERFEALATAASATQLVHLQNTRTSEAFNLYSADYHALSAFIQIVRTAALMAYAVNPDYGSYNWDMTMVERDANQDGVVTPQEYAPGAPFTDLDAASWSGAGTALADSVDQLRAAIDKRPAGDARDCVNLALQNANLTEINNYLTDAKNLLAGEVSIRADYAKWNPETNQYSAQGTMQLPFNLRQLWQDPPASFRSLLPPLYIMLDDDWGMGSYTTPEGVSPSHSVEIRANWEGPGADLIAGTTTYHVTVDESYESVVTVPIGAAPHQFILPASGSFAGGTLSASYNWTTLTGTLNGASVTLQREEYQWGWNPLTYYPTWDSMPDLTITGMFPDPAKIRTLITGDYDTIRLQYGSIVINDENTLPIIISQN